MAPKHAALKKGLNRIGQQQLERYWGYFGAIFSRVLQEGSNGAESRWF